MAVAAAQWIRGCAAPAPRRPDGRGLERQLPEGEWGFAGLSGLSGGQWPPSCARPQQQSMAGAAWPWRFFSCTGLLRAKSARWRQAWAVLIVIALDGVDRSENAHHDQVRTGRTAAWLEPLLWWWFPADQGGDVNRSAAVLTTIRQVRGLMQPGRLSRKAVQH